MQSGSLQKGTHPLSSPSTGHKFTFTAVLEKRTRLRPTLSRHTFQSYTHTLGFDTGKAAKSTFFGHASSFDQQTDFSSLQRLLFEYFCFIKYNILFPKTWSHHHLVASVEISEVSEKTHCTETTVRRVMGIVGKERCWKTKGIKNRKKSNIKAKISNYHIPILHFLRMKTVTAYG